MNNLWGKLLCAMFGHIRGRRITHLAHFTDVTGTVNDEWQYQCPRCLATWTRKVKVKP